MSRSSSTIQIQLRKSYLAMITHSLGTCMYQRLYFGAQGRSRDITERGVLSCAYYVSCLLHTFKLLGGPHATVSGCLRDMERSGWRKIRKPKTGCVIFWEPTDQTGNGVLHAHLGFYIGHQRAISNSTTKRVPVRHHWTFGVVSGRPKRRIIAMYDHPLLM